MRIFLHLVLGTVLCSGVAAQTAVTYKQQAYVKAQNPDAEDFFGVGVAISGDTMVVGAHLESSESPGDPGSNSRLEAGAAYVYVRESGRWRQQTMLKPPGAGVRIWFGRSVAIDGDTIAVGAPRDSEGQRKSGSVFVFVRQGESWMQQAQLRAENIGDSDHFGWSVAIDGDTIVAGAYQEDGADEPVGNFYDNELANSGAAYVFVREGAQWRQQAYLKASNRNAGDAFGLSVAVDGDTIAVGAYKESGRPGGGVTSGNTNNSGAAYVFERGGDTWAEQAYLKSRTVRENDHFGYSVALSGDDLVVGAKLAELALGTASMFHRQGGKWEQGVTLLPPNHAARHFGHSVALEGDTLVVGSVYESSGATGVDGNWAQASRFAAGSAYVYGRGGGGQDWNLERYLKASNPDREDYFGQIVDLSDGTIVIGASGEDSGSTGIDGDDQDNSVAGAGAAYVFLAIPTPAQLVTAPVLIPDVGVLLTTPYVLQRQVGIEFSPDLSPGSWIELGNFQTVGDVNMFLDQDPTRSVRASGFYRAFLR